MARLSFRCGDGLVARVDVVRGREPREAWLRRAVEQALVSSVPGVVDVEGSSPLPAPAEQPVAAHVRGAMSGHLPTCRCGVCRPVPKKGQS